MALFKIKNESFDKNRFGLSDNEFLLDVISGFSFSKNINTTTQPVLDGSQRMTNVSREPGSLRIEGLIGEHHFARGERKPYINPTQTRGKKGQGFSTLSQTVPRTVVIQQLLEYLRDEAIFLDIYAQNGKMIYRNYILKQINYSQENIDALRVSLNFEEVLMFENPFFDLKDETDSSDQKTLTNSQVTADIKFVEPKSSSQEDIQRAIANMVYKLPSHARAIIGAPLEKSGAYNVDYELKRYMVKANENGEADLKIAHDQSWDKPVNITVTTTKNTLTSYLDRTGENFIDAHPHIVFNFSARKETERVGTHNTPRDYLVGGYKIWLFFSSDKGDTLLSKKEAYGRHPHPAAELMKKKFSGDKFFVSGGSHYVLDEESKAVRAQEKGWSFLRPVKEDKWGTVVNLLGDDSLGYLYNATFSTHGFRFLLNYSTYLMYMNFIWIHPVYWQKIKERLQLWVNESRAITLDRKLTN
ncbi:MAG: hypothetical protein M0R38_10180 [Bacteroidia bacterium]|nr:hypothetical protein [Bacteroidia bacterium]